MKKSVIEVKSNKNKMKHQTSKSKIKHQKRKSKSNVKRKKTNKVNNSISDEGITPIIVEPEPFNPLRRFNAFLYNEIGRKSKIKHQNQKSSMKKQKKQAKKSITQ